MIRYPSPLLAARNSPIITPTRDKPMFTFAVLMSVGTEPGKTTLVKAWFLLPPRVYISVIFS